MCLEGENLQEMKVDDANFAGADIRRADVHDVDCKLEIISANPIITT